MFRSSPYVLVCLTLLGTACGRGQLDPLGLASARDGSAVVVVTGDGSVIPSDGGPRPGDAQPVGRDATPFVPDGSTFVPDGGQSLPDGGPLFECQAPADCFATLGVPACPGGGGRWQCLEGKCLAECPMPRCQTDCDCPPELACTAGGCQALNRPNFCCEYGACAFAPACQNPDGTVTTCPGAPDGGVRPDGGPPRPDGGRPDGGRPRPDGGPRPDGSVPNPDGGPRPDGSVPNPDGGIVVGPDGGPISSCMTDCDCDPSLACSAGQCVPLSSRPNLCCANPSCPPGSMCVQPDGSSGVCGAVTPVGAACDPAGTQCGASGFCIDEGSGFPGGYCSQGCGRMSPCPSGASCRGGGGNNFCLDECTQPTDCRPGYNCIQLGVSMGSRVCWPVPPTSTNPMGAAVGSGCAQDDECAAGLTCLSEQGFPGGYCTALYCDPVTNPCPANSGCYAFPGLFSLCLAECPSGGMRSTCRPQYYCLGPSGQPGVCIGN
jgi:hypothetical protein